MQRSNEILVLFTLYHNNIKKNIYIYKVTITHSPATFHLLGISALLRSSSGS